MCIRTSLYILDVLPERETTTKSVRRNILLLMPTPPHSCITVYHDEPYTRADRDEPKSFYDTRFEITPCCNVTGEAVEVTLWFRTHGNFSETDAIYFDLPSESTTVLPNHKSWRGSAVSLLDCLRLSSRPSFWASEKVSIVARIMSACNTMPSAL